MTGKHARRRPRWLYLVMGVVSALAISAALFLAPAGTAGAAVTATVPSQDACHRSDNYTPRGNCGVFHQVYADDFGTYGNVPVGAFTSCGGDGDYRCAGLKSAYPHYYGTLGAYPVGWPDTAGNNGDGNSGPVPGVYRPDHTVSVYRTGTNDGQLRVHMYRPSAGGSNQVAALVPLACKSLRYGKFSERFIVRSVSTHGRGFKMAHLHYSPDEIDYPEAGETFRLDPVSWFNHGFDNYSRDVAPNSAWWSWHTYSTEITPGHVKVFYDGTLVSDRHATYPRGTPWVLQNESALNVPASEGAPAGSHVDIDTTWLACYSYQP